MTQELPEASAVDPHLVSQAARTHAQRAEEAVKAIEGELHQLREDTWTRAEHDEFWADAKEESATARRKLNTLLAFSAMALVLVGGLWAIVATSFARTDDRLEDKLASLSHAAVENCEQSNAQAESTRELYSNLALLTTSPQIASELAKAASVLPEPTDCSVFEYVPPVNQ